MICFCLCFVVLSMLLLACLLFLHKCYFLGVVFCFCLFVVVCVCLMLVGFVVLCLLGLV